MTNFKAIAELVNLRQQGLEKVLQDCPDSVYGSVSEYWQGFLDDRPNFMSAEEFHRFRSASLGGALGLGDTPEGYDERQRFFNSMIRLLLGHDIEPDLFDNVTEPILGNPEVFPYRDNLFSANFVKNVVSAYEIGKKFSSISGKDGGLDVCEIGAGFGSTAYMLHEMLNIRSYTLIDLPENLYLSSLYLPLCMPNKSHGLVSQHEQQSLSCSEDLNFCIPNLIDTLEKTDFDLVINVASMGEMPLATAQAYSDWVATHLKPDGLFYFVNRQGVGDTNGARCFTDYKLDQFDIKSIVPRRLPSRPANAIHYEVVAAGRKPDKPIHRDGLDAIGYLTYFGIGEEIEPIIDAVLSGNLNESWQKSVEKVCNFFRSNDPELKWNLLQDPDENISPVIMSVLKVAFLLVSQHEQKALEIKDDFLTEGLGLKLFARMTGLFAEAEKQLGHNDWQGTVHRLSDSLPEFEEMMMVEIAKNNPSLYKSTFTQALYPMA